LATLGPEATPKAASACRTEECRACMASPPRGRAIPSPVVHIFVALDRRRRPASRRDGSREAAAVINFNVNGQDRAADVAGETPLLWVLRETLGLTGTKFGCGMALCGACTVHLDGEAVRSCVTPVSRAAGKHVTTIEGLSPDMGHPLQRAWIEADVPQCGYCQ